MLLSCKCDAMATTKLRFVNRVVLVTGAGNGLGKAYALAFGARGANVVVNDLGGDIKGGGQSARPADLVVEEIRSEGGTAIANYDSVEDGEKIVNAALDKFGRIDAIVNNAGILRDRSFARITDMDWDIIQRIHLQAVYRITQAAWPHMKKQKYGRVITISSSAGIYGNFGQANYSSAKMGVVGLMNTLAVEGMKDNIFVNTVAPVALSRLTKTVASSSVMDSMQPEHVAPLILWLCHEDCNVTGQLFECAGGWMARLRWQRAPGVMLRKENVEMTPEDVRDNWDKITDFTDATYPASINEAMAEWYPTVLSLQKNHVEPNSTSSDASSWEKAVGVKFPENSFSYSERDAILYALGVGVSTQHDDHLKFLYEGNAEFAVLPTYAVIPAMAACIVSMLSGNIGGFHFDPALVLHGEQYTELYKPLAVHDDLVSSAYVADVLDKGSGAVLICNTDTCNSKGERVAFNQTSLFIQHAGGFGGRRTSDKSIVPVDAPQRPPDVSVCEKTSVDQAALYRLSGDRNPLHIDPSFAALGGFSTPILHGLCSFGYAGRHVLKHFCDNDVSKFKAIKVRFSNPVLPGQTLQTDMWKENSRVFVQCKVVETGKPCLVGSYVDLCDQLPVASELGSSDRVASLQSDTAFRIIEDRLKSKPDVQKAVNGIYLFNITVDGKNAACWTVDVRTHRPVTVQRGQPQAGVKPDCTLTVSDGDFIDMATGKLDGNKAFTSGRLKVAGNMMLALQLESLFSNKSKL